MSHLGVNCPISKGRPHAGAQILWPERRDLKLLITKAGPRTIQISWSKRTVCSVSRNKDKGDAGILKGICYIICWSGNLLLSYYLPSICMVSQRQLHHCKNMPVHAANTTVGSQPSPRACTLQQHPAWCSQASISHLNACAKQKLHS